MKPAFDHEPFPRMRRLAPDIGWLTRNRYAIRGLLEIDVTLPRQLIHAYAERTGERLSFTAFLTACVGQAVGADRHIQAMRNWRGELVIFEDVDISVLIEREQDGKKYPLAHIVRAANHKTLLEIHHEIRQQQKRLPSSQETSALNRIVGLPRFLRRGLLWIVARSPEMRKQNLGTVTLSAVGMFGNQAGWGMGPNFHTLGLLVGSIVERPGVVNGRIEVREILYLTLDFDHDLIDGAPAARFAQHLAQLIESGYGLTDLE
jgi:pyruvate/2-oxoglutarate dehydrogenase complex dihydrolipoamide acyltransferase (E2) component